MGRAGDRVLTIDPTPELARWGTVARQYLTECTEMPHTPGPWTYSPNYGRIGTPAGTIAVLQVADGTSGKGFPADEQQANARLIAAAPELLEALEAISGLMPTTEPYSGLEAHDQVSFRWTEVRGFVAQARAAIAKAKGE